MKVMILKDYWPVDGGMVKAGEYADLPDKEAKKCIDDGVGEKVEKEKAEE